MSNSLLRGVPSDLLDLINDLIIYEEMQKIETELEYLYDYDYSDYPEHDYSKEKPKESTIIRISL